MSEINDALLLVGYWRRRLPELGAMCAHEDVQRLLPGIRADSKHCLGDLQSALEYAAHAAAKISNRPGSQREVSFPYARRKESRAEFESYLQKRHKWVQGLSASAKAVFMECQAFAAAKNDWLPAMMELSNTKKHAVLSLELRKVTLGHAGIILLGNPNVTITNFTEIRESEKRVLVFSPINT